MFALSRDGKKIFVHQPESGMVVPVLLDIENRNITVRIPSIEELSNDYAIYDSLDEIIKVVGRFHREEVSFAGDFSRVFSDLLREQLSDKKLKISEMRKLVVEAYNRPSENQDAKDKSSLHPDISASTSYMSKAARDRYSAMTSEKAKPFTVH